MFLFVIVSWKPYCLSSSFSKLTELKTWFCHSQTNTVSLWKDLTVWASNTLEVPGLIAGQRPVTVFGFCCPSTLIRWFYLQSALVTLTHVWQFMINIALLSLLTLPPPNTCSVNWYFIEAKMILFLKYILKYTHSYSLHNHPCVNDCVMHTAVYIQLNVAEQYQTHSCIYSSESKHYYTVTI